MFEQSTSFLKDPGVAARSVLPRVLYLLPAVLSLIAAPLSAQEKQLADAARNVKQIIAHRGASSDRPENTLAAYRRAIALKATALEIDVRTTKDGKLVSLHDATLERTTTGTGKLKDKSWANVRTFDAGTWFDPQYKDERIPTLRQILKLCKGKIDVLLDLKEQGGDYAKQIVAEIRRHGEPKRIIVGVRSVEQARLFRKLLPEARQLGLIPKPESIEAFAKARVETIRLWPKWLTDDSLIPRVRAAGSKLHLNGTTGKQDEVAELLAHRPDSLSSDDPGQLVRTLKQIADD